MEGYYTGVLDIYYALITKPETATTKPVYAAPAVMGKTIEVTITPNYKEGSVYASNVATRNEKRVDSYTVSVNVDKLPYAVRKALLGRTQDSKGVQIIKGGQKAPEVAIGFAMTLDDGQQGAVVDVQGNLCGTHQHGAHGQQQHDLPAPDD